MGGTRQAGERGVALEFMSCTLRVELAASAKNSASLQAKLKNCNYCRPPREGGGGRRRGSKGELKYNSNRNTNTTTNTVTFYSKQRLN